MKYRDTGEKHQQPEDKGAEDRGIEGAGSSQGVCDSVRDAKCVPDAHQHHRDRGQEQRNQYPLAEQASFKLQAEDGQELFPD